MRAFITGWLLLFSILCFGQPQSPEQSKMAGENNSRPKPTAAITEPVYCKIIPGIQGTFGYDIFVAGKMFIHQPDIPCLTGKEGFQQKADAEKVAQLVIAKIRKGIMPPAVTKTEMRGLGIPIP